MFRPKTLLASILFTAVFSFTTSVYAATYYVSTTGSDSNPGTESQPFLTFSHAVGVLGAGDTLYIYGGTYSSQLNITVSGTNGSPITITAVAGQTPIIDVNYGSSRTMIVSGSYVNVSGLELRNSNNICELLSGTNITSSNMTVTGCTSHGTAVSGQNITVSTHTIYNTVLENENLDPGNSWGSALKVQVGAQTVTVQDNLVYENYGEGIAVTRGIDVNVLDNIVYDNYSANIYLDNSYNIVADGNFSYCSTNDRILRSGSRASSISIGEEYYSGWGAQLSDLTISNNILGYCNHGIAYLGSDVSGGGMINVHIYHNTLWSSVASQLYLAHTSNDSNSAGNVIANNIIQHASNNYIYSPDTTGISFHHNFWMTGSPPAYAQGTGDLTGNVQMATTPVNSDAQTYKLDSSSTAIDAGTNLGITVDYEGNARPQASGYDMGAYEYVSGANSSPTISLGTVSPDPTTDTTPSISGTASDADGTIATVQFQVDSTSGAWTTCTAGDGAFDEASETFTCTTSTLSSASHTIFVRAQDDLSAYSSNSSDSFVVDTNGPTTPGTPSTTTPTTDTTPTWTWSASTDSGSGLATPAYTFQWCGNSGFTSCDSNTATSSSATYTHVSTLALGTWYVRVKATDTLGNVSSWSSNGTVTIQAPPNSVPTLSITPVTDPTSDTTPTLSGTATDSDGTINTVEYQMDSTSGAWSSCSASDGAFDEASETFTCTPSALSNASHTMYVRAQDNSTDYSSNSSDTFLVDAAGPTTPGTPSTTTPTTDSTPTWTWSASSDSGVGLANPAYSVQWCEDSGYTGCGSNVATTNLTSYTHSTQLSIGTWYFRVRSADSLSNTSSWSSNGTVDVTSVTDLDPTLSISTSFGTYTSDNTPSIAGTAADADGTVAGVYYQADSTGGSWTSCTANDGTFDESSEAFVCNISTLGDGAHTIYMYAQDNSANTSANSTVDLTVDATAPTIPGDPTTLSSTSEPKPVWNWTASTDSLSGLDGTTPYSVRWSKDSSFNTGVSTATATANSYTHSVALDVGTWYFQVRAKDAAGNYSGYSNNGTFVLTETTTTDTGGSDTGDSGSSSSKTKDRKKKKKIVQGTTELTKINGITLKAKVTADSKPWANYYSLRTRPVFSGTGTNNVKVRVSYWPNKTVCETKIKNGTWECTSIVDLAQIKQRIDIQYGTRLLPPFNLFVGQPLPVINRNYVAAVPVKPVANVTPTAPIVVTPPPAPYASGYQFGDTVFGNIMQNIQDPQKPNVKGVSTFREISPARKFLTTLFTVRGLIFVFIPALIISIFITYNSHYKKS